MAMVVRELLTTMGYKVDRRSFATAEQSLGRLKAAVSGAAVAIATGALAQGFGRLLSLGSDASETLNVINASFGDQADAVVDWASTTALAVGRSEFQLREYAATLGAILKPMTGNADAAAEMSKGLAKLTVDLASFFNATEEDTLLALRSGLTGEMEPLKRFGIVMSVAALDAFALSEGLGKTTKQMTEAEKTALRYRFIMARTVDAQGDAERTAAGYANASKALGAALKDLGTDIGRAMLPQAEASLAVMIDLARAARGPVSDAMDRVMRAMRGVGSIMGFMVDAFMELTPAAKAFAIAGLAALTILLAPGLLVVALLGAIGLAIFAVVEDLQMMEEGGTSVIGSLVEEFQFLESQTGSSLDAIGIMVAEAVDFWADKFGIGGDAIADAIFGMQRQWNWFVDDFLERGQKALEFLIRMANPLAGVLGAIGDDPQAARNLANIGTAGLSEVGLTQARGVAASAGAAGNLINAGQSIAVSVTVPPGADAGEIGARVARDTAAAVGAANRRTSQQLLKGVAQ